MNRSMFSARLFLAAAGAALLSAAGGAAAQATSAPEFAEAMKKGSTSVLYLAPADLRAAVVAESNYWGQVLKNPRFAELIQ